MNGVVLEGVTRVRFADEAFFWAVGAEVEMEAGH